MHCVQWCVCVVQAGGKVVYSDVCLWYRVREKLFTVMCVCGTEWEKSCCSSFGSRIWVRMWVSVNGCTAQLVIVSPGTVCLGSYSHLLRSVCGTSPLSAQCSAAVFQLHSDFGFVCIQNGTEIFLFYCDKITWDISSVWGGLRRTQMVCVVRCLV
jgi:hypothetical protein